MKKKTPKLSDKLNFWLIASKKNTTKVQEQLDKFYWTDDDIINAVGVSGLALKELNIMHSPTNTLLQNELDNRLKIPHELDKWIDSRTGLRLSTKKQPNWTTAK